MNYATRKSALSLCCFMIWWGWSGPGFMGVAVAGDVREIHQTVIKEIDVHRKIQESEDQWAAQKDKLVSSYQELLDKKGRLEKQNNILTAQLAFLREKVAEADRKIVETERVKTQLQSTLESIASRLAVFIQTDLPFLIPERSRRLEELKALLSRPDEMLSEKCRRTLEAMQVETEYGRSFQVSEQTITLDNQPLAVDVLRTGRLSLFFRTPDGQIVGGYNRAIRKWQMLPAKYKRSINHAVEMAMRQRPMDLVELPLGKIEVQ